MSETLAIPCAAALILRTVGGLPCVLLQTRQKVGAGVENGLLELPAGKVREFENVFETLRREVGEETGLTLSHIEGEDERWHSERLGYGMQTFQPYCVSQNVSGGYSIVLQTFVCRAEGEPQASDESHSPRWVPLAQLAHLLVTQPEAFYPLHLGALHRLLSDWHATPYVFVYGTLKPACKNSAWASAVAQPLEATPATLRGFALHHLGAYPAVLPQAGGEVRGVVYRYPAADMPRVLAKMDELEDYFGPANPDNLYHRELCEVVLEGGELCRAWVYVYARAVSEGSRIAGGEWRECE